MAENAPPVSFGSTRARNALLGNQFSGTTNINFNGSPDEAQKSKAIREACLRSLAFRAMDTRRHDIAAAHPDTCGWLFATPAFQRWRSPEYLRVHNGVLWIKGKPGAGKSTLMKYAFSRFHETFFCDHLIVSYFFNARGQAHEKSPLGMLRSIVYQLLLKDDSIYRLFIKHFEAKDFANDAADLDWLESELRDFIRVVVKLSQRQPLLLVIDALDECNEPEVRAMISFLEELSILGSTGRCPLKIFLSSRHYPNITMTKVVELTVELNTGHQKDIAKYLKERFGALDPDMKAEILQKADGIFLWVVLVLSMLKKDYDEGRTEAMRKSLDDIPGDIEKLFSAILEKETPEPAETVLMLQWVLLSRRPLSPQELFVAAVKRRPPTIDLIRRRITTSSKGLIELRKGNTDSVQFIHLSVRDFLFRQNRLQRLDPTLGPDPIRVIHWRLWSQCRISIEQAATVSANRHLTERSMQHLKNTDRLLSYAASHILDHAEAALPSEDTTRERKDKPEHPELPSCPQQISIRKWLQGPDRWFQWWQSFLHTDRDKDTRIDLRFAEGTGLLYLLAAMGLPSLVRLALLDVESDAQHGRFGTPLGVAAYGGHIETVQLLLDRGADVNAQGGYFGTPLQAASFQNQYEVVQLLLNRGANYNALGGAFDTVPGATTDSKVRKLLYKAGTPQGAMTDRKIRHLRLSQGVPGTERPLPRVAPPRPIRTHTRAAPVRPARDNAEFSLEHARGQDEDTEISRPEPTSDQGAAFRASVVSEMQTTAALRPVSSQTDSGRRCCLLALARRLKRSRIFT